MDESTTHLGEEATKIVDQIRLILREHMVSRASLFGSILRKDVNEIGDLDVLVELPSDMSLLDVISLKFEIEDAVGMNVDLVEFSMLHPRIKDRVLSEQQVILP